LDNLLSQGKAREKIRKEVMLSPDIKMIPGAKNGFTIDYWVKLKKVYENMSLMRIIDWEGNVLIEVNVSINRQYNDISMTQ
jgi:hypothetical protein